MKVLVLGASGKTGQRVVDRAVLAGHTVTAFVRDAASYDAPANVRVVTGSATDPASMVLAVAGQEAVIDTVGGKTPWRRTTLERDVASACVSAMKDAGVRRLIVTSAIGVGDSVDQSGALFRTLVLHTLLRGSTRDKAAMEELVHHSGLDFVIARPAVLKDAAPTGSVRVFTGTETAHEITRADLADWLVEQLQSDALLSRSVTIANR